VRREQGPLTITTPTTRLSPRTATMHVSVLRAVLPAVLRTLYHLRNYIDIRYRRPCRPRVSGLARLHVRVSARAARRGDHFLLMTSLGIWDFRVNALISHRRGRNHALMLGWGCGPLLVIGSGWVLALRDGLLNRIVRTPLEAARAVSGLKQEPRKIRAAPAVAINCARATHVSSMLPATLLLPEMAHTVGRTW
jgi:hypothetical protein